jgi:hypothetical protein
MSRKVRVAHYFWHGNLIETKWLILYENIFHIDSYLVVIITMTIIGNNKACGSSPFDSGYDHGCDDAII